MNILFMFYSPMLPYMGGVQRVTDNLAKELKARGHNVYYLSIYKDDEVDYNYPVPQLFLDEKDEPNIYVESYQEQIRGHNINIVINQEPRADLLALLAHTPEGVKKITCYHLQPFFSQGNASVLMKYYRQVGVKALLFKYFCRLFPSYYERLTCELDKQLFANTLVVSDRLCLLSEKFIPRIIRYMPEIEKSKLVAVNNPNSFIPAVHTDKLTKEKIILWVGRHSNSQKNFPLFLDFWRYFHGRNPEWKALVLGTGVDFEYNKKYNVQKKVRNVEFLGRVTDVAGYYSRASFLVMTSNYEGWGMILTEAMNYGCIPCAFDTYESLHDIIDNGINGIIVPRNDYQQMVSQIETLLASSSTMSAMQIAAIEKTKNFTVDKIVDKWEAIFDML